MCIRDRLQTLSQVRPLCPRLQAGQPDGLTGEAGRDLLPAEQLASGQHSPRLASFLTSAHQRVQAHITEAEFLAGEQLGVEAPRRCARCKGCRECSEQGRRITEREEAELRLAELRAALRSREVTTPPFIQVSRQRN